MVRDRLPVSESWKSVSRGRKPVSVNWKSVVCVVVPVVVLEQVLADLCRSERDPMSSRLVRVLEVVQVVVLESQE